MRALLLALALLAVPVRAADSPAPFTEVELLRIENTRLEGVLLQRQLDDWQAKKAKLKADVERTRDGWLWDPDSGAFTKKATK